MCLESTMPHMLHTGHGDEKYLLKALSDFIIWHEALLSVNPDHWEPILYAGHLREKLVKLSQMRRSGLFEEFLQTKFPLCPRTLFSLQKVFHIHTI